MTLKRALVKSFESLFLKNKASFFKTERKAGMSETITGRPDARASKRVSGRPSQRLGRTMQDDDIRL